MNTLRCGLVGCGRHGRRYLDHLRQGDVPGLTVSGVWRRDRGAESSPAPGARWFDRWDDLVEADTVDAVLVLTPPGLHADAVRRAVEFGKPVLVEKPLTGDFAAAEALAACLGPHAPVMVAHTLRFAPALQRGRELLERIGSVHRLRVAQRLEPSDLAWQRDRRIAGGGSITLTGVHLFDLVRWWSGRTPDAVQAMHHSLLGHPMENLFDACFEDRSQRILAATEVSKFTASRSATIEAIGTEGQLLVDYRDGVIRHTVGRREVDLERFGDVPTLPRTLDAFARWVRGEIECPVTLEDGVETLRMAEGCYRSQQLQRRVELATLQPTFERQGAPRHGG